MFSFFFQADNNMHNFGYFCPILRDVIPTVQIRDMWSRYTMVCNLQDKFIWFIISICLNFKSSTCLVSASCVMQYTMQTLICVTVKHHINICFHLSVSFGYIYCNRRGFDAYFHTYSLQYFIHSQYMALQFIKSNIYVKDYHLYQALPQKHQQQHYWLSFMLFFFLLSWVVSLKVHVFFLFPLYWEFLHLHCCW